MCCKIKNVNGLLVFTGKREESFNQQRIATFVEAFSRWHMQLIPVNTVEIHRVLETSNRGFFTFAFLLDEDTQMAKFLEDEYRLKVFNDETAINTCLDRALLAITLRNANLPSPATIILPYVVNRNVMEVFTEVKTMMKEIRYPVLIKNRHPQVNEKIYLIHDDQELQHLLPQIGMQPLIAQAYIPQDNRQLFKVMVVGNKALATVEVITIGEKEFLKQAIPPKSVLKTAIAAARVIGASYALISVFLISKKNPYVYSAKTNPNIVELQVVTGTYLTWYLARHVYQQIKKRPKLR